MINLKNVKRFCRDDLSLIENYDEAMNDKTQTWCCHHKLEIELNLSVKELIEKDLYYNRPHSELILLTREEHNKLHSTGERNAMYAKYGNANPMYKKNPLDYMTEEDIKEMRRKRSINATGAKNGRYHTKQMYKDGVYETVKYEDINTYLNNGWIIKGRGWNK